VRPGTKPWWQQATALVTVSTGGVITGFTFAPGAAATMTSPTSMPLHLLALEKAANPADAGNAGDARLRPAIVNVAGYYLQLAQTRTPAQMEALIWGRDSLDGADHGPTCAAFASLTLELAAQAVGQQSWVSGGTTYPWPLHEWADVRVDPNPDSLGITSILQDAQAHDRWHPLGDGYVPRPGDWVLFDGHVEVVTSYADGVLDSIGADSAPNLTVNAHSISGPLADQGVVGFVDNGHLDTGAAAPAAARPQAAQGTAGGAGTESTRGKQTARGPRAAQRTGGVPGTARGSGTRGLADVPGIAASATGSGAGAGQATGTKAGVETGHAAGAGAVADPGGSAASGTADIPGATAPTGLAAGVPQTAGPSAGTARDAHPATAPQPSGAQAARNGASAGAAPQAHDAHAAAQAAVPGVGARQSSAAVKPEAPYRKYTVPNAAGGPGTKAQQAFINQIAPGAMAAQQRYGVPASVTIAQAIDESNWGQSGLAAQDNNLFGIKGTGPAGAVTLPTQEYVGGQWESVNASFRMYHNIAESIADHAELLATSGYYQRAMADRAVPDAFANDLTGVYATDPEYGANLIALMRLYNLYRFDAPVVHHHQAPAVGPSPTATHAYAGQAAVPGTIPVATSAPGATPSGTAPAPTATPSAPTATPATTPAAPAATPTASATAVPAPHAATASGNAAVPGIVTGGAGTAVRGAMSAPASTAGRGHARAQRQAYVPTASARGGARIPGLVAPVAPRYQAQLPPVVATAFFASAKTPLARSQPLYRDVASQAGIPWELLAACDWMQCQAHPRFSPVHGEKIGTLNSDGTAYMTKSEALAQCASDLVELAAAVYRINLTAPGILSVRDLANAFAAFRWGGLLKRHRVSAMEFPYSVAGLTPQHLKMHWPAINDPGAPDKPGAKFRMAFGAVPVVLSLNYPATV
jgi:flagellum-specific peptidoglycan hydrolase FlgJ